MGLAASPLGDMLLSSSFGILVSHPGPQGKGVKVTEALRASKDGSQQYIPICLFVHSFNTGLDTWDASVK